MGIFGSLFGKKKSSGLPPELSQLFDKIAEIMEDENMQNSMNHPMIQDQIINGLDVDELPDGVGDFGHAAENPIPVNGALGELLYLSLLKTKDTNLRLLFHRLGSVESLDMYETVSIDGRKWDILFLSMYHPRKSKKTPNGYDLADYRSQPLLYGTNQRVKNFPYGLQSAIQETTEKVIGIPLPPPQVREAEERVRLNRPPEHENRIKIATQHVQGFIS